MATADWQTTLPTNLNYLSPVNFDFLINKLPKTRYFCVGATLPNVNFSEASLDTKLAISSYVPGDKITFEHEKWKYAVSDDEKQNILIDDFPSKIDPWDAAGGIGILHINADNTIKILQLLKDTDEAS